MITREQILKEIEENGLETTKNREHRGDVLEMLKCNEYKFL